MVEFMLVSWASPKDDKGNPPPSGLYGDMIPRFQYGRWWVCHADMLEYGKRIAQDRMAYAGL